MAQHFLLSKEARNLSLRQILCMSEKSACMLFAAARWQGNDPACPRCGVEDKHYFHGGRLQWRCKACRHVFSVTSGTVFAHHKLPLNLYLGAMLLYSNSVKGIPALKLARDLNVQYKTAFVLAHKMREAMLLRRDESPLDGEVEMDGAYFNGHIRPANKKANRIDRRKAKYQRPDKRVVITLRSRGAKGCGGKRTLTFVAKSENQISVARLAKKYIAPGTTVFADEAPAYDVLSSNFVTRRINHQVEYRADDGTNTNTAEGYFSRLRRMQYGVAHHFSSMYLDLYANEAAYREDNRRRANGTIFADILGMCATTPPSKEFSGYWQGNHRVVERLV